MSVSTSPNDSVNTRILTIAEDCVEGFYRRPFHEIAARSGVSLDAVLERLRAMHAAGVVRRIRQTLLSTKLAEGALVAWKVPERRLEEAYEWLKQNDPFTGHVVVRRAEKPGPGSDYRLWTTLKVPSGCNSPEAHCELLGGFIGAERFVLLPTRGVFALGVGHMRRRYLKPGDRLEHPAAMQTTLRPELDDEEWEVLLALKESLSPEEITENPWNARAAALGMSVERFCAVAERLNEKRVIGRFATFLEHVRARSADGPVTQFNGLFHWAVPPGMEERAGAECGRHLCMTHCYWRTGGDVFGNAQIMGVVHGLERRSVLDHKAAIDAHLEACGIPVLHTAVFWSERSEVKPSEISPARYRAWWEAVAGGR